MQTERQHWALADLEIEKEHEAILSVLHQEPPAPVAPSLKLDRQIYAIAKQRPGTRLSENWILNQGSWVILVTCILIAGAMLVMTIQ